MIILITSREPMLADKKDANPTSSTSRMALHFARRVTNRKYANDSSMSILHTISADELRIRASKPKWTLMNMALNRDRRPKSRDRLRRRSPKVS